MGRKGPGVFAFLTPKKPKPTLLALGDSIISDCYPGVNRGAASLVYRNLDNDFPEFEGQDLSQAEFINTSRTGFRLVDVETAFKALPAAARFNWAILSVGGNDLLAGELEPQSFEARYGTFVKNLRARCAHLAILNAYDPTQGTGLVASSVARGKPPRLDLIEFLTGLNAIIARQAGPDLVDVHGHFMRHPEWFQRDIEPTGRGASEIRRLILRKFRPESEKTP